MTLDRRLHAFRNDLADISLKGTVDAPRYTAGRRAHVSVPVAPCLNRPDRAAPLDTEFVLGELLTVFDERDGFAWAQSGRDGYVGYVPSAALSPDPVAPTHRVSVPMALVYTAPSIKVPVVQRLPLGAALVLGPEENVGDERIHAVDGGGYVLAQHVAPWQGRTGDFVTVAEAFLGTPYLYGGKSAWGVDCSALIQLALDAVGIAAPRDSDMQNARLGTRLPDDVSAVTRGDLIFWRGHAGIVLDEAMLLHANGHHMLTAIEPLAEAIARLKSLGLSPTSLRRVTHG